MVAIGLALGVTAQAIKRNPIGRPRLVLLGLGVTVDAPDVGPGVLAPGTDPERQVIRNSNHGAVIVAPQAANRREAVVADAAVLGERGRLGVGVAVNTVDVVPIGRVSVALPTGSVLVRGQGRDGEPGRVSLSRQHLTAFVAIETGAGVPKIVGGQTMLRVGDGLSVAMTVNTTDDPSIRGVEVAVETGGLVGGARTNGIIQRMTLGGKFTCLTIRMTTQTGLRSKDIIRDRPMRGIRSGLRVVVATDTRELAEGVELAVTAVAVHPGVRPKSERKEPIMGRR